MSNNAILSTVLQVHREVEAAGFRGIAVISAEQLNWLRNTLTAIEEMGAEFLAQRLRRFIESAEQQDKHAGARLLELLTTLRLFERALTLEAAQFQLGGLCAVHDSFAVDNEHGEEA
ncbi:hypothetical protein [Symmachiella dynata]|uniref:Uncharacterized protein n=1 Tax=Symmachiella dynata TaxID=2527995 RepID=A0A517ZQ44_9PLAN|nr:hypothetical protein [Symmachiella dynata]QDT48949.1 hypothetical protein Pan258_29960 [Symmachiella dynata]QDU44609.1 hypothetical protein Mal52_30950 [Symmachiella dynata]